MAERLTINEAISHAREVAEKNRTNCKPNTITMPNRWISNIDCAEEHEQLAEWLEELKHYKDLEKAGRLVKLPCAVGDTVWDIKWWDDITETKVIDGEKYFRRVMKHKVTKSQFRLFDYDNLGKTVFLTREEAEAALKGAEE